MYVDDVNSIYILLRQFTRINPNNTYFYGLNMFLIP